MKVELLVNLKTAEKRTISAGTIYSDEEGTPIPEFILRRLRRGMARVIVPKKTVPPLPLVGEQSPPSPTQKIGTEKDKKAKPAVFPKEKTEAAEPVVKPRKVILKKGTGGGVGEV
jgi:hypothetical protein